MTRIKLFQITNNIWQGRFAADRQLTNFQFFGITHILNVSETPSQLELNEGPFKNIVQFPIRDGVPIPVDSAVSCCRTLHDFLCEPDSNIYIHCVAGWNRSPTILWLYLIACGIDDNVARDMICSASIDAVPAHPKLITPSLTDTMIEYGAANFIPHPRNTAIERFIAG
ncbi:protein-tyrosine phosphatase family protein [Mariniblastus fucicola]|uniref:protein-tyrosine phosphatase family protein n=1 Tax=Mariniblastus fucicola TaxID=980251 RepID=UPI0009FDCFDB